MNFFLICLILFRVFKSAFWIQLNVFHVLTIYQAHGFWGRDSKHMENSEMRAKPPLCVFVIDYDSESRFRILVYNRIYDPFFNGSPWWPIWFHSKRTSHPDDPLGRRWLPILWSISLLKVKKNPTGVEPNREGLGRMRSRSANLNEAKLLMSSCLNSTRARFGCFVHTSNDPYPPRIFPIFRHVFFYIIWKFPSWGDRYKPSKKCTSAAICIIWCSFWRVLQKGSTPSNLQITNSFIHTKTNSCQIADHNLFHLLQSRDPQT